VPTARTPDGLRRGSVVGVVLAVAVPVVVALLASVLAGALTTTTLSVRVGTTATRALMDVAGVACVGAGLVGLLVLVAPHRELLDAALPPFSALAAVCLGAVAVSGGINALVRVESWAALVTTGYGLLVVAKVVAIAAIGALGGLTRARLRAGRIPVLRWAGYETAFMLATIGLAAALTQSGT
jgi:putative copper resistance protein D